MPSWRDYHRIALVLGTILRTIDCLYLQLPDGNPPLAELKASQSEEWRILYPITSVACAFSTARCWYPCWMVAQLGQTENYSVSSEMHKVWAVNMISDANAMPGIVNCPLREYKISSRGLSFMRSLVGLQDEWWDVLCSLTNKTHKLI